jgi:glucose dehydrogenase
MANPDVIIIGAGLSGSIMALELAKKNKTVWILEAGPSDTTSRRSYQDHLLKAVIKLPEAPYPPYANTPDQQNAPRYNSSMQFAWPGYGNANRSAAIATFNAQSHLTVSATSQLPFLSTYERITGGTTWHWLGTSLRLLPNDFRMQSTYGQGKDWPLQYSDLESDYGTAEATLGVSGDVADQAYLGLTFPQGYAYPMARIKPSYSDQMLDKWMAGLTLPWLGNLAPRMVNTPQARNSVYNGNRRACAGNNSCIPLCPIQAKFDATITLKAALQTGKVKLFDKSVVSKIQVDTASGQVSGVEVKNYVNESGGPVTTQVLSASAYVLAAHAIEIPRLLLNSATANLPNGVANRSGQVGRNLMDHVVYLGWGLSQQPVYPYRGPRSSGGIEALRDGAFRSNSAAFRVDVGNEGWGWADSDPNTITNDYIDGKNGSGCNPKNEKLFGSALAQKLNWYLTRMVRFCYLVEQLPNPNNRVQLSATARDGLGIPRPEVTYGVDAYTLAGLQNAVKATDAIFAKSNITNMTVTRKEDGYPSISFSNPQGGVDHMNVFGAGHIVGTACMGNNASQSVVNSDLQSHDHKNLFILGSAVFPTVATGNPTLTIAALTYRAARKLVTMV